MSASPLLVVQSLISALHLLVKSIPTIKNLIIHTLYDMSLAPQFKTTSIKEKERISKISESHNKYLLEHLINFSKETRVEVIYLRAGKIINELHTDTEFRIRSLGITNCVDAAIDNYNEKTPKVLDINNEKYHNSDLTWYSNLALFSTISSFLNSIKEQNFDKNSFFYWDNYHFTTKVHKYLATNFLEILENSDLYLSIHHPTDEKDNSSECVFGMDFGNYIAIFKHELSYC
ncbi:11561_t:CDS:1 [Scutellospora calospora]|uniref:11561_t:CDS:1 n=1 Tax=Scutellospora calospora TaxID=85575 RepID=A0ACA9M3J5_9GLOM|nr:11561_t:CDS:1 [Scutellospora calospora]